jgi:hypothetical protein
VNDGGFSFVPNKNLLFQQKHKSSRLFLADHKKASRDRANKVPETLNVSAASVCDVALCGLATPTPEQQAYSRD